MLQESDEDTTMSDSDERVSPQKGAKTQAEESVCLSENSASKHEENEQVTDEEVLHKLLLQPVWRRLDERARCKRKNRL